MNNQVPNTSRKQELPSCSACQKRSSIDPDISKESGVGHVERAGNEEETYFTYEELQQICVLAGRPIETVH